jgi:hypothetical protein
LFAAAVVVSAAAVVAAAVVAVAAAFDPHPTAIMQLDAIASVRKILDFFICDSPHVIQL